MTLQPILHYAHSLMENVITDGDIAVDATCGNGHDTLFLTGLVGEKGHVYGFDVQEQAITKTEERLKKHLVEERVTLVQDSHSQLTKYISPVHQSQIKGAIFNLGYLPGSDKTIVTKPAETISSIEQLLSFLPQGGMIVLVIYYGHAGGKEEKDALTEYVSSLDQKSFRVLQYGFINQRNTPPFIIAIEKT
ncbi:tRNA (mnm(5)s(2)U34)-methyltransferase [Halobacillus halophilus]|uniref:tRNA (mnm(5)s(2)U34)-methyltransferase n=1 Tax=Halobacillus halophilus TaxID=1570 RepID=UPI001CD316F2|nr:class I SAM-dependent methyltransferase [Halobacillus halophilus]MCA1011030.1 methyltransferase domain-containing protein [Halobacillus halophilus]